MKTDFPRLAAAVAMLGAATAVTGTPAPAASIAAAVMLAAETGTSVSAADLGYMKAGFLTCNASSGSGFIFGSSRTVQCVYSARPGVSAEYTGSVTKFGVDIGYLRSAVVVWGVLAPTSSVAPGALAGNYAGVTAGVAGDVGANALISSSGNPIMLQPLSIDGETGLNVAAGVAALTLGAAK